MSAPEAGVPPASNCLVVRNRQRTLKVNCRRLKHITQSALEEWLQVPSYDLSLCLLSPRAMARMNRDFLNHEGPTDVLTFDYSEPVASPGQHRARGEHCLRGEILVCPAVALDQAKTYQTSWPLELTRYVLHGVLHLLGYDDKNEADRAVMKQAEDQLLRQVQSRHDIDNLG